MFERSLAPARRSPYATRALPGAVAFHLLLGTWAIARSLVGVGELPPPPEPIVFATFSPGLPDPEPETESRVAPMRPQPTEPTAVALLPEVVSPKTAEAEVPAPSDAIAPADLGSARPVDGAVPGPPAGNGEASPFGPGEGSGAPVRGEDFIRLAIGARPPQVLYRAEPRYLEPARRARIEGIVELDLAVDASGRVLRVEVVRGLPLGLTEEAARAVRQWRFKPAESNGRPVPVLFSVIVHFTLR